MVQEEENKPEAIILSFLRYCNKMGKEVKIPPTPRFRKTVDVSRDYQEPVESYEFVYARDTVRVDIYMEAGFVNFTYSDNTTRHVYNKLELDFTSLHQLLACVGEIEKRNKKQ